MSTPRRNWDEYFLGIADAVSTRATCDRLHVGAVIVRDRQILATGYNGALRGLDHCDEVGHLMIDGHCERTVHAEANAVAQAAREGIRLAGSTCYVTASPCWRCFLSLASAGIVRIVSGAFYREERTPEFARLAGIEFVVMPYESLAGRRKIDLP